MKDKPEDLKLREHEKVLSKNQPSSHLCIVADYLVDPTTKLAIKAIKILTQAMARVTLGIEARSRERLARLGSFENVLFKVDKKGQGLEMYRPRIS